MSALAAPPRYYPRPLHGVLHEVGATLRTLEKHMATVADNGTDAHELAVVLPLLIQVRDVCALTSLNGPHLLLVEMVRVVEGVIEGDFEQPHDASNALMFAAARLPGYVHRLELGGRDRPVMLLPVLNDLRAVRGATLFSDAVMRLPLFRLPPDDLGASHASDTLADAARKIRPHYMRALLNLIRGDTAGDALAHMAWCLKALREQSRRRSVRMLWLIAHALVDGLQAEALELKPATKSLLGQIEQCIKLAVAHGERDLVVNLPPELLRSMLFYCAEAGDASEILNVVRQRYQLSELGRFKSEGGEASDDAPAPSLLFAARDQVQRELERVRDAVLAFSHSDVSPADTLKPAGLLLERVCETLGVLGMTSARTTLHASLPMFQAIRDRHSAARALGTLAEVLLQGSRLLNSELERQCGTDDDLDCSQELDVEQSALTRMPREERRRLLAAVIHELRAALEAFEIAVVAGQPGAMSQVAIESALDSLRDAKRALDIVPLRAAHDAFSRLVAVLERAYRDQGVSQLDAEHALVEAVSALDLYLRALEENDLNGRGYLRACFTALLSLEQQCTVVETPSSVATSVSSEVDLAANDAGAADAQEPEKAAEPEIHSHPLDRADSVPRYCHDAALRVIFVDEATEHLALLRDQFQARTDDGGGLSVDEKTRQVLAAFAHRARLAEAEGIAVPLLKVDRLLAHYERSSASVSAIEMKLITETLASVERSLKNLSDQQPCDTESVELVRELDSLASVLGVEPETDSESESELRSVFLEEANELVGVANAALAQWAAQPDDEDAQQRLMRALHTMKGSARVAGCNAIADGAHALESKVALLESRQSWDSGAKADLLRGLDRIAEQVCGAPGFELIDAVEPESREPARGQTVDPARVAESTDALMDDLPSARPDAEDMLRVRSSEVGSLASLANDVGLHRVTIQDSLIETQNHLEELGQTVRRLEEHARASAIEHGEPTLPAEVQESLRDFDLLQQNVRDQMRMSRAALDAQRQSGSALQDGLLKLRLVTFSSLVPRLQRVVRQSADASGKKAELSVTGETLTLDRGLLAKLAGPLEHLVRNAVVHGIELPEKRAALGKAATGRVVLHAFQQQGSVQIRVADDGSGIDTTQVRQAATAQGLDVPTDDDALVQLILMPGFSTLGKADDHAGRGVGLDVVNRQIRQAGGNLGIQTQPGAGAVFGLRVPQAFTIEKSVLVRAGELRLALPVRNLVAIERVPSAVIRDAYLKEISTYGYDGASFPVQHLGELLGVADWRPEAASESESLVLMDMGEQRVALHVDSVVEQRELPVHSGGVQLQNLRGYSGASVLADGEVVLMLDVSGLLLARAGHDAVVDIGDETRVLATAVASTVMVVDDSVTMRRANSHILGKGGYRVLRARNGLDALQQLQEDDVDALVLDLDMPGMDGYQLLERLRDEDSTHDLPVVVVSARAEASSRARVAALGVTQFLEKPCTGRALLETIDRVVAAAPVT